MKVGDKVTWESSSSGYTKVKTGEVVAVIPAYEILTLSYPDIRRSNSAWGGGLLRNHESYVVKVGNKLYWPLVKNLRRD